LSPREETPLLSVVIPAYRAERTIGDCLESLSVQWEPPPFEVVVVDSSPDDATEKIVRPFTRRVGGPLDLEFVRLPSRAYPGRARNRGAELARAARLLFLDADCVAFPDLLSRVLVALEGGAGVVGAAIGPPQGAWPSARVRHLLEFKESLPGVPFRETWQIPSACMGVDRRVLERHAGFPDTRAAEDWLLNWRMWQAGERMLFDPRLRVIHLTPAGWRALARYSWTLGRESGRARRRGGLPGQALVRHPWLCAGLPLARTLRALVWSARFAPRQFLFLMIFWPAYLVIAAVWAAAFYGGVREHAPSGELACPEAGVPVRKSQ
jgi:glycosyltransferase involved in cell wall biosynthesis